MIELVGLVASRLPHASAKRGNRSGSCRMVHNVRLEAKAKAEFKLSVEAAGRREVNKFARLKAGGGDTEAEEGAIEPEDDRRAVSATHVSRCNYLIESHVAQAGKKGQNANIPSSGKLCAESLLPKLSS